MKNTLKKIFKFVSSRALYLLIGLFLALAISTVYAAWNTTIVPNSGTPLTSALWNDMVAKLVELDGRYCYTNYSTSSTLCVCPTGETNKKDLGLWGWCTDYYYGATIFRPAGLSCVQVNPSKYYFQNTDVGLACVCCK
ncbi:hypothetical protein L6267_01030 [Candidatus Parcubacteria bacterium]|nr:hypothetical protein [Candidatus Parcubacteria bacterium]